MTIDATTGKVGYICETAGCHCLVTTEADEPLCQRCAHGTPARYVKKDKIPASGPRGKWVPLDSEGDGGR